MRKGRMRLLILTTTISACGLPQPERDVDYESMFVHDRLVEWKISFENEDWHELYYLHPSVYVPADVEVDGVLFENVGVRIVGNKNRSKVGWRIRFDEFNPAHRFHGVKRVNLRNCAGDPTLVREALALHLMRSAGIPAPRSSFVWIDWGSGAGVYTLVEQVDRRFLEDRFGEKDGNLYRMETGGSLVYREYDPDNYEWVYTYELQTNEEWADYGDLVNLMKVLDQASGEGIQRDLPRALDVDGYLLVMAVNNWLSNLDSYAGTGRNYYLYRDSFGRFRFIPWDLNRAFGNYHGNHCNTAVGEYDCMQYVAAICKERLPQDREYCAEYGAEVCAEYPNELCYPETWETMPEICEREPPPECETCSYHTVDLLALDPDQPTCNPDRSLVNKVLQNPAFKQRYHEHLRTLINGVLAPSEVEAWMESMRVLISDHVSRDICKEAVYDKEGVELDFEDAFYIDTKIELQDVDPSDTDYWDYPVPGLLPFILARDEAIRGGLGGS